MRIRQPFTDCDGRRIRIGDRVRVARSLRGGYVHPEFLRAFQEVAGQLTTVVGRDTTSGAWVPFRGSEVITLEPYLLKLVRRGRVVQSAPNYSSKRTAATVCGTIMPRSTAAA